MSRAMRIPRVRISSDTLPWSLSRSNSLVQLATSAMKSTIIVDILPVNSAPIIYSPSLLQATEDLPVSVTGVFITDSDIQDTAGSKMKVNVTVQNGSVSFSTLEGLRIIDGADSSLFISFEGSLTRVNYVLSKMIFTKLNSSAL